MKKLWTTWLLLSFFSLAASAHLLQIGFASKRFATGFTTRKSTPGFAKEPSQNSLTSGKSTDSFSLNAVDNPVQPLELLKVNIKATRDFIQRFPGRETVDWYKLEDGYIACFNDAERKCRAGYDETGKWLYNLYSYSVDQLPKQIRHTVIFSYPDSKLLWANEIKRSREHAYIVQISENDQVRSVWVTENDIHELSD